MSASSESTAGDRTVGFFESVVLFFKNYFQFSGRSSRGAYWWSTLAIIIIAFILGLLDAIFLTSLTLPDGTGPLGALLSIVTLIPGIAIGVRRLHDTGHSGWWLLIAFTGIGLLLLLWWYIQPADQAENKYGPNKEAGR